MDNQCKYQLYLVFYIKEALNGLEPLTDWLQISYSTNWAKEPDVRFTFMEKAIAKKSLQ